MLGRGAAAATDDINDAVNGPALDLVGQLLRRFVIAAEGIGQAGVGVGRNSAVANARQFLDVLAQFLGAECAVQAEGERLDVVQRIPEGLGGLPGQRTAGSIGDGAGDHHRPAPPSIVEEGFDGEQRGLGVECVEDGFDQQDISAALDQTADRFGVVGYQFVESDVAVAGVVDVRRYRSGAAGRAEDAGDETRLVRIGSGEFVAQFAGELGAFEIQFVDNLGQVVIGLRNGGRVEGAGFENVGVGFKIGAVDATDDLRSGQHQQVVVAFEVVRMILEPLAAIIRLLQVVTLDHRAHRTVEDEQALGEEGRKF